jgi:hypothetical protein
MTLTNMLPSFFSQPNGYTVSRMNDQHVGNSIP